MCSSLDRLNKLYLSGFEPILRKDLAGVCRVFYLKAGVREFELRTGGLFPELIESTTSRILDSLNGIKLTVLFALHGLESVHDSLTVRGGFNRTIDSISKIRQLKVKHPNLNLLVNTIVSDRNIDSLPEVFEFVKNELAVDLHTFSPSRMCGREPPTPAEYESILKTYRHYLPHYLRRSSLVDGIHLKQICSIHEIIIRVLQESKLPFPCPAGDMIGVVEPDGGVRLCEAKEVVGNLRDFDYDFKRIWFSEKADEQRKGLADCSCTRGYVLGINPAYSTWAVPAALAGLLRQAI
jgi:MoaA/NifB/PqqE/SkfB family radical SAM enzyme